MPNLSKETVESDLRRLKKSSSGSSFWRVDLHTHSPASADSRWPQATTPLDLISAYDQKGISIIAITDHSTGAWVDQLIEAAKKFSQRVARPFVVLPGVELNANGIHVSAILPESATSASISLLLGRLGLRETEFGKEGTCVFKSISDIAAEVRKDGGLLIGAHCNSTHGVVEGLAGMPRRNAIDALTFLELHAGQSLSKATKTTEYVARDLRYPDMPFVYSSDSHGPMDITEEVSLVKMDFPGFSGLRQLQFEPKVRTSGTSRQSPARSVLIGVVIDGGLYQDAAILFNSDLNVVIGGRGAGKSALVDMLSFCLGHHTIAGSYQETVDNRLAGFLAQGDQVRLYFSVDGMQYCACRAMAFSYIRESVQIDSRPEVFRLRSTGPIRETQPVGEILPMAIYGQGEVTEITKKGDDQLALIDSFTGLAEIATQLRVQRDRLDRADAERIQQAERKASIQEEVAEKPVLQLRISEIDDNLKDPVFAQHQVWEDQKLFVDEVDDLLKEVKDIFQTDPYSDVEIPDLPDKTSGSSPVRQIHSAFKGLLRQLKISSTRDEAALEDASKAIAKATGDWQKEYAAARATLQATLKKLKLSDIEHAHSERNDLQRQLNKIQRQHEPSLKRIEEKLASLSRERASALDRIGTILDQRTSARQSTAESLTGHLPANVRVRIMPLADTSAYFNLLNLSVLGGLGIRSREKHIQSLVTAFKPRQLASLIRKQEADALTNVGLSEDACAKVLGLPEGHVERIEECLLEDQPIIELRREGHTDFAALDHLSIGEKCSVILSLLLSSEERPLIIDEPEAELDHEFICSSVVESIRSAKGKRQILICTHNPNIPVLGDAELVIKVAKSPGEPRCFVEHAAGFEHEQSIHFLKQLEGGEAALRMRSSKYHMTPLP